MNAKVYALIVNNQITKFPVTETDINNSNKPTNNYLQCFFEELPEYNAEFEYLVKIPVLVFEQVIVKYKVKQYTLNEKLTKCLELYPTTEVDGNGDHWINMATVPQETVLTVIKLVKDTVQKRLDTWASTKGYDDCKSVCGYSQSVIPEWQADAARAIYLRDTSWFNLYSYLADLQNGLVRPIRSANDLETYLPVLSWT